jgi:iron complex transport system ATP-binding protein
METGKPILKLTDLQIGFNRQKRQKEAIIYGPVSMTVSTPKLIGIIGKNGIGKSTLLRTIAGLQSPVNGTIEIMGKDSRKIHRAERARLISFVSTEIIHVPDLLVADLVSMGRFPYTAWLGILSEKDHEITRESMALTGTTHLARKPVHELSDGERQKVMIARALSQDTPVIILDEPTAFLDLPARYETIRLLNDLAHHKQKVIMLSTHDLSIAMDEADMLWLMTEQGLLTGSPEDLVLNHAFRKLFGNNDLSFDNRSMSFRYRKKPFRKISITGEETFLPATRKAMERLGYEIVSKDAASVHVEVKNPSGQPLWCIKSSDQERTFATIHELTSFLRQV